MDRILKNDLTLLRDKMVQYVDGETSLEELESYLGELSNNGQYEFLNERLTDIFHLIQHYDSDVDSIDSKESMIMSNKIRNIAGLLVEYKEDQLATAISEFFSNPYTE